MRTVDEIIADLDTDPPEWWPMSRAEARLVAERLEAARQLLREALSGPVPADWEQRALAEVRGS